MIFNIFLFDNHNFLNKTNKLIHEFIPYHDLIKKINISCFENT